MKKEIENILKEFGITKEELMKDIEKQMSYTYSHRVKYKNYIIAQDENTEFNDVIILKDNKEIFHCSCNKQFTDDELKEMLVNHIENFNTLLGDKENGEE